MNARQTIESARQAGVEISADGGDICCRAPAGALTDDLRAEIIACKGDILALLARPEPGILEGQACAEGPDRDGDAVEEAILARLAMGNAHHAELLAEAYAAGASDDQARQAVRRLQEAGQIHHTLAAAGYASGSYSEGV